MEVNKNPEDASTQGTGEVDYASLLAAKDAELAKVQSDRDNYRKGLLKAKGKDGTDDSKDAVTDGNSVDIEALIEEKISERLSQSEEARIRQEKDALLKEVLRKNSEMALALKNRGQVASTVGGSNLDKDHVATETFFSAAQIEDLKAKGLDPEKVKANYLKSVGSVSFMPPSSKQE